MEARRGQHLLELSAIRGDFPVMLSDLSMLDLIELSGLENGASDFQHAFSWRKHSMWLWCRVGGYEGRQTLL